MSKIVYLPLDISANDFSKDMMSNNISVNFCGSVEKTKTNLTYHKQ